MTCLARKRHLPGATVGFRYRIWGEWWYTMISGTWNPADRQRTIRILGRDLLTTLATRAAAGVLGNCLRVTLILVDVLCRLLARNRAACFCVPLPQAKT